MRKQTKFVAVASAAAVLAIGASMTSFAATGWVEEDGVWYYYDKDGNKVDDEWKKSGDSWYWLDSEEGGGMAVDKLIEDGDDTYYVDSNGQMVRNTWVKVVNEDQDDDDDPAEYNYYYMQSNGKAYTAGDSSSTKFRTIDGKRYAFDDDGKMLYGWVDTDSSRLSGEDDWSAQEDMYYCGNWDDGAMKTGWQMIYVHDDVEDDDMEHWFNFKSNGKKRFSTDGSTLEKTINSKKYGFDDRGVMVYEWTVSTGSNTASASSWKYFSSKEDGARKTKGWFKVVAPNDDNTFRHEEFQSTDTFAQSDADDEEERWYYADGDGELYVGEIKKIKGKYYGFYPDDDSDDKLDGYGKGAAMISGLVFMSVDESGKILRVYDDDIDSDDLDDIIDGEGDYGTDFDDPDVSLFYFGNNEDADGAMKTGTTTINLDGDSYSFLFSKSGGAEGKGRGRTGIDDDKYIYKYGKRMKADSDDKYIVVKATGDIADDNAEVSEIKSKDLRSGNVSGLTADDIGKNKDSETVKGAFGFTSDMYLVNTSGSIIKNKTAAKDGDDWYFYVDKKNIKMYLNNKTLKVDSGKTALMFPDGTKKLEAWKDYPTPNA